MTSKVNNNTELLAIMNSINNDNIDNIKANKPGKQFNKPKQGRSAKMKRTDEYWLKTHNKERRKQTKVSYNQTHRQDEQPDPKDEELDDIHFANALGCSKLVIDGKMSYSDQPVININMVESLLPADEEAIEEEIEEAIDVRRDQQARLEEAEWVKDYDDYDLEPRCWPSDDEDEYDEEQDRADNYTESFYDERQRRYRIWKPIAGHPKGGRIVCESDDENSQGSCF